MAPGNTPATRASSTRPHWPTRIKACPKSLSALATAASWLCYYRALQLGDAAQVTAIDKSSVVLVALFAVAFLGDRLSWLSWLGVLLIGAGAVALSVGAARGN